MNDFFTKVQDFFFDVLGLMLPGGIFLLVLLSPLLLADITAFPHSTVDHSMVLSTLSLLPGILKTYWSAYPKSSLTIALIIAYLAGHVLKVFSKIMYDILILLFDRTINRGVRWLASHRPAWLTPIYPKAKEIWLELFRFDPPDYFREDENLRKHVIAQVEVRLGTPFPEDWYSLSRLSAVIGMQENLRSLASFYLAKYNLYRSLSLIFLFTTMYYMCFFRASAGLISPELARVKFLFVIGLPVTWFTFHVKYKRYWTLTGDNRLYALFYILNKQKLYEAR